MGSTASSAVTAGDIILASHYNNLRLDVITNHDHSGGHGAAIASTNPITFASGATITAGSYQVGRDADGTNQLHFNAPNGATMEWSINDVAEMTLSATALDLKSNNLVFSSGSGISFAATSDPASGMTSELLDDYEEGTFTPTIGDNTRNGTSEGQAYSTQLGRYCKIGNWVFFQLTVIISDIGSMTNSDQAAVLGLPYSTENTAHQIFPVVVGNMTSGALPAANAVVSGFVTYNSDNINLRCWDVTTGTSDLLISEMSPGANMTISGHYKVA